MSGFEVPNHTQTPNSLFDEYMKNMTLAELKIVLAVCRKTFGWHKKRDMISISQLQKITGLSKQGVLNGINKAIERGILSKSGKGNSFEYSLLVNEIDNGQRNRPFTSQRSRHTKERLNKKDLPKELTPQQKAVGVLSAVTGLDYKIKRNAGRLAKIAKELKTAGYEIDDIEKYYSEKGWWYMNDWRGKKGQKPTPEQILETVGKAKLVPGQKGKQVETDGKGVYI